MVVFRVMVKGIGDSFIWMVLFGAVSLVSVIKKGKEVHNCKF